MWGFFFLLVSFWSDPPFSNLTITYFMWVPLAGFLTLIPMFIVKKQTFITPSELEIKLTEEEVMATFDATEDEYDNASNEAKDYIKKLLEGQLYYGIAFSIYLSYQGYSHYVYRKPLEFGIVTIQLAVIIMLASIINASKFWLFTPRREPLKFFLFIRERKRKFNEDGSNIQIQKSLRILFPIFLFYLAYDFYTFEWSSDLDKWRNIYGPIIPLFMGFVYTADYISFFRYVLADENEFIKTYQRKWEKKST